MKIQTGYLYHIKDEFFDIVNDDNLMSNHERGKKRPTYFTIKDKDILWFIPLSSKVEKYTKIVNNKMKKYGWLKKKENEEEFPILANSNQKTENKYH